MQTPVRPDLKTRRAIGLASALRAIAGRTQTDRVFNSALTMPKYTRKCELDVPDRRPPRWRTDRVEPGETGDKLDRRIDNCRDERESVLVRDWSALTQWSQDAVGSAEVQVQTRLRGNHLHVLCEAPRCPPEKRVVSDFERALKRTRLESLLPADAPKIYKIFLCGRSAGAKRPDWTVKLEYPASEPDDSPRVEELPGESNPLLKWFGHRKAEPDDEPTSPAQTAESVILTPVRETAGDENPPPAAPEPAPPSPPAAPALAVSTENRARSGNPDAIASVLSEILGGLGVSVKVNIRGDLRGKSAGRRLWVLCESAYSPDPSLLAEPIAGRLRELQLEDFRDACILLQVRGETTPDWMLRIDLTPPDRILRDWARWGDDEAIARLLNRNLADRRIQVRATRKESTLHLFCHIAPEPEKRRRRKAPDKATVQRALQPLLDAIAPQGIRAATLYGLELRADGQEAETPVWIDWLNLPAFGHPDLQTPTATRAAQGDIDALKFLLERLINPDLETKLATGGTRVLALRKGKLLHVMSEAPTCPSQSRVALPIARFLRSLEIEGVAGVRIYGRRAGQKYPLWRYGIALKPAPAEPTDFPTEETFAPSEAAGTPGGAGQLVWSPAIHLDRGDEPFALESDALPKLHRLAGFLQQGLIATGLFASPAGEAVADFSGARRVLKVGLAAACSAAGLLLVWQGDRLLGAGLDSIAERPAPTASQSPEAVEVSAAAGEPRTGWLSGLQALALNSQPPPDSDGAFNDSGFTARPGNDAAIAADCQGGEETASKCRLSRFLYPTFRSQQLDEQLARYQQYIATHKRPPDVLIIGSSRALRGVDPDVLERALIGQGHPPLKVFNFGVNGATVKVVDLIIRRILPPEQLPQLIVVADGVRALNSGREDRTYEAISTSEGYQQISQGTFEIVPPPEVEAPPTLQETLLELTATAWKGQLNLQRLGEATQEQISRASGAYARRDRLKAILQAVVNGRAFQPPQQTADATGTGAENGDESPRFEANGFLPLSVRFNPETYYQNHPTVSGYYDGDYQGFELDGKQTQALKNTVAYVQSFQIPVVFVNMPLTEEYLDPVRGAYEEKFRDHMEAVAAETGLVFVDLTSKWLRNYDYFSDPSHLNQYGAAAVSEHLATVETISWPGDGKVKSEK